MDTRNPHDAPVKFFVFSLTLSLLFGGILAFHSLQMSGESGFPAATYSHGVLHLRIPYQSERTGTGRLTLEVLDPEDNVLGSSTRRAAAIEGPGQWRGEIKLDKELPVDDLVWHRIRYRFDFDGSNQSPIEGTESISQILRRPVIHIIGQQSYLSGGPAAVRVIVTDSENEVISGRSSVRIEFLNGKEQPRLLFENRINNRGTAEAEFQLPSGVVGQFQLRYTADTPIGTTEFTQNVRLENKVSILLTADKPIYQPSQTIHVRALALDRSDHKASGGRKLTFVVEDSHGNKVFKRATETDEFGVASAEFKLADEVNLGTYHLRALMGDAESPSNTAEIALNVQRYVLPKFKVAVELGEKGKMPKRGYRPGDHVTGTVRANYFFGKPVDRAEISMKASAMDVELVEVASAQGTTDADGTYHFDLTLPKYFAGRPLANGAARVLIEATVKDNAGHSETRGEPITVSESPLLITAVPEGGTLVPNLDNQIFILTSYPDGTPAKSDVTIRAARNEDQHATTDEGGIAVILIKPRAGSETLRVEAADREGNRASSKLDLQSRQGD
ncbi:MAG: MG2 domain-containing protein, partial [Deltaproteobacteria bacterium]